MKRVIIHAWCPGRGHTHLLMEGTKLVAQCGVIHKTPMARQRCLYRCGRMWFTIPSDPGPTGVD